MIYTTLLHETKLKEIGKLGMLNKHWNAGSTVAYFLFGRNDFVYVVGDIIAGAIINERIVLDQ